MSEKVALIGAGSAMFTRALVADMVTRCSTGQLALVDVDPLALEVAERLSRKMIKACDAEILVTATTERREALPDATAVVATVGVGGRRAWEQDVFICRRNGIYPSVGDTVGPAGSSRAMRTIPPMVAIAEDVVELAPDAVFINYTNPMSPVCRAIGKETGARVIGLCHGLLSTLDYLADRLGVNRNDLSYTAAGYNHLTWITGLSVHHRDAMRDLHELADMHVRPQLAGDAHETAALPLAPDERFNPFSWQLFQTFGAFPAPADRHVVEFFPALFPGGHYFGMRLGVHRGAFSFENTIRWGDKIYESMAADARSASPLTKEYLDSIPGEHQHVFRILRDIRRGHGGGYTANLPNDGAIPNLPDEAVVEGNAAASADGLRLTKQQPLPPSLVGTLANRLHWAETIVEAAIEADRDKFVQALIIDGYVTSIDQASTLADELLATHTDSLPGDMP